MVEGSVQSSLLSDEDSVQSSLPSDSVQSPLPLDGGSVQSPLNSDGDSVQSPLNSDGDEGLIGILYNEPLAPGLPGWEASRDVLVQVEAVAEAVDALGQRAVLLPVNGDPAALVAAVRESRVGKIFNLCESVNEDPTLTGHPAAILELMGIPFTGSSAFALMLSTDKAASKLLLQGAGIKTPCAFLYDGPATLDAAGLRYPLIAKPRFEDASIGIDQDSIFRTAAELAAGAQRLYDRHGPLLIEEYIAGRELNVAVLAQFSPPLRGVQFNTPLRGTQSSPPLRGAPEFQVLAVAEIDFSAFPKELYPIVGYRAKWDESAFEYHHTPRIFPGDLPPDLVATLHREVLRCCEVFQLRDYGRVDLRLDETKAIYVLEVNANPCLSPDAGFCAAALHNGIEFKELVRRLLSLADSRR